MKIPPEEVVRLTEKIQHFYMNSAEVLDAAFGIYKKSFWEQLLLYAAFSYGMSVLLMIIIIPVYLIFMVSFISSIIGMTEVGASPLMVMGPGFAILIVVVVFIIALFSSVLSVGNFFMTKQVFYGEKKSLGKAFSDGVKAVPRCFLTAAAKALACVCPCIFLLPIAFMDITTMFSSAGSITFFVICLLLFVLAFVILDVLFIYAIPVTLHEKIKFFKALKKSFLLLKGSIWKTIGVIIIVSLVSSVFSSSIVYGIQFAAMFLGSSLDQPGIMIALMLFQYLISFVLGALTGPIGGIVTSVLYFNQKIQKDGLDIEVNLARLESESDLR